MSAIRSWWFHLSFAYKFNVRFGFFFPNTRQNKSLSTTSVYLQKLAEREMINKCQENKYVYNGQCPLILLHPLAMVGQH
jgi:hypothetical protein